MAQLLAVEPEQRSRYPPSVTNPVRIGRPPRGVQSVEHALSILTHLGSVPEPLGLTELSTRLGLGKSTVHAMLVSLARGGYVERDEATPRYRLGSRLVQLAGLRLQQSLIRGNARPILEQLVQETGETAFIGAVDGNRAVYIDRVESQHRLRVVGEIGAPVPLHATALGKALLAQMPPDRVRAVLESPLEVYSRHTILDPKRLAAELDEIRSRGVAFSRGERDEFTVGVAAPARGYPGMVITAITVAGMIGRLNLEASTSAIRAAADQLSTVLSARIGPDE